MKIFISWSGDLSRKVAELLSTWLEDVLQGTKAWRSEADIDKGKIWFGAITEQLSDTGVGILCLTLENRYSPWILFEAGALSKGLSESRVCPFLIDLQHGDLWPPLSQFNGTLPNKEDVLKLVKTINGERKEQALPDPQLLRAFDLWWPKFEEPFKKILANHKPKEEAKKRSRDDILEEILELSRSIQRSLQQPPPREPSFIPLPESWAEVVATAKRGRVRRELTPEDMERIKRSLQGEEKDKEPKSETE
jgi:hypothetical protein